MGRVKVRPFILETQPTLPCVVVIHADVCLFNRDFSGLFKNQWNHGITTTYSRKYIIYYALQKITNRI